MPRCAAGSAAAFAAASVPSATMAMVAAVGITLGSALAWDAAPPRDLPAPAASGLPSTGLLLDASRSMQFTQTGTDGVVRRYRFTASPNLVLERNEGRLYVLTESGEVLLGAVALSHPELGLAEDAPAAADRGLVWGVGPVSGNTRANYTLADGTSFSVPLRRVPETPWEVSVIDGLTAAQREQGGSATDDRGVPVLR